MKRTLLRSSAGLAALALAGCLHAVAPVPGPAKSRGHGPPPHAPAHGYRAKTPQGVDVVFDTGLGVYVVVDVPGVFWLDEHYYRRGPSGWQVGVKQAGPWKACAETDVPPGLRKNSSPGKSGKAKGKKDKSS